MTTLEGLEQTIQDFIDECSEHDDCTECPCLDFCLRFKCGPRALPCPCEWKIEKVEGSIPC